MIRRILRYEVDVNDRPKRIGDGPVLMAQRWRQAVTRRHDPTGRVEVWVEVSLDESWPATDEPTRLVQVFGTGREIPIGAVWLASCLDGPLVWHLYEVAPTSTEESNA